MAWLHSQTPEPLLHRDLKSLNILLDHEWNAKVRAVHSIFIRVVLKAKEVYCYRFCTVSFIESVHRDINIK